MGKTEGYDITHVRYTHFATLASAGIDVFLLTVVLSLDLCFAHVN